MTLFYFDKLPALKKLFSDKSFEIEARFGKFENRKFLPQITKEQHDRIYSFFSSKKEFYEQYTHLQHISMSSEGIKRIENVDDNGARVLFMKKEKIKNFDVPEYDLRIGVSKETILKDVVKYIPCIETMKPKSRYRETFTCKEAGIKIDLSRYETEEFYEVEIEIIHEFNPKLEVFLSNINHLICIIQNTYVPISKSEIKNVLKKFKNAKFPGVQPVALKRGMINKGINYSITKKLDGIRAVSVVINRSIFLYRRDGTITKSGFIIDPNSDEDYEGKVFDGELYGGDYHIFDYICDDKNLEERINYINLFLKQIITTTHENLFLKEYIINPPDIDNILMKLADNLEEKYDGLIIVKTDENYKNSSPLKWKKVVTFDFAIYDSNRLMYKTKKGLEQFCTINIDFNLKDGEIVECFYTEGRWYILKSRGDKKEPNFETTVMDNWKSIKEPYFVFDYSKNNSDSIFDRKRFISYVKRVLLDRYCKGSQKVIDIDFGDGQDIAKYIETNIKTIHGVTTDIKSQSIIEYFMNKTICKNFNIQQFKKDSIPDEKYSLLVCKNYKESKDLLDTINRDMTLIIGEENVQVEKGKLIIYKGNVTDFYDEWKLRKNILSEEDLKELSKINIVIYKT